MMPNVFVLGPSFWRHEPGWDEVTPQKIRHAIAGILCDMGVPAFVMESQPHSDGELWQEKFYRLLEQMDVTHVLLYWPPQAHVDAAEDEAILLAARKHWVQGFHPSVVLFGHRDAVSDQQEGENRILWVRDDVGRSSYLGQLPAIMPTEVHEWSDHGELIELVQEWARANFPDIISDDVLERDLQPLKVVLKDLKL